MPLLQLINISFSFNSQPLFKALNLNINKHDKIGLIGHNGCGKSSLLALINQQLTLDQGEIRKPHSVVTATVEQFVPQDLLTMTLLAAVCNAHESQDHSNIQWRAQSILADLGFTQEQLTLLVSSLSGGQQNLMLLARAIIQDPDLLLLDEPGNHMDILAMTKLQQFLAVNCRCAFLIISHDQYLLNNVCNSTVFIRDARCQKFELPFDRARLALEHQDSQSQQRLANAQQEIDRLKASAKRLGILGRENDNAKLSRQAKSIEKRVLKLDSQKTQLTAPSKLRLAMTDNSRINARQLLSIKQLCITVGSAAKPLLQIEELLIKPGDRIALLGINGVGKSSTLETIKRAYHWQFTEQSSNDNAAIRFNPRVKMGYYDQSLQQLEQPISRLEWLAQQTSANEQQIKQALIKSGVDYLACDRLVDSLSGGEKSRMMFLAFTLNQPNLLILDEPTNHIDLAGKAQLVQQLIESAATLLITSHDRYFLEQVANRFLLIDQGKLQEINRSELFYDRLLRPAAPCVKRANSAVAATPPNLHSVSEEALLARIEQLEKQLELEQAQSKKRQKPVLQKRLQEELNALWQQI